MMLVKVLFRFPDAPRATDGRCHTCKTVLCIGPDKPAGALSLCADCARKLTAPQLVALSEWHDGHHCLTCSFRFGAIGAQEN